MKKLLIVMALFIVGNQWINAQVKFGVKAGMSTADIETNQILINSGSDIDELGISVSEANYGLHFGLFLQGEFKNFFIQPEVLFNSNSVDYAVEELDGGQLFNTIKNESYQYIDIPVMLGCKFGPLRLGGGPVGHFFINSSSELFEIEGYDQKFNEMTLGWQAGVGLDFWKLLIDIRYEGNFSKYGDHFVFFGNDYSFDNRPGKFVASVGFAF